MKRCLSFFLAMILLLGLVPASEVSAVLVNGTITQTFDEVGLGNTVTSLPGYKGHHAATVSADPVEQDQALRLCDSANANSPYFHYTFDSNAELTLEFDVYVAEGNVLAMQLLNGNRSNSNTAYWLQFRTTGIFSYDLNGSTAGYIKVSGVGITVGKWHNIRLEINTAQGGEMKIHMDGTLVGTAARPNKSVIGSNAATVDGVYFLANQYKNKAIYLDNLKATTMRELPDIVETQNGMYLQADAHVASLEVKAGQILDLNGFHLYAEKLACFGSIVDYSEKNTGTLTADTLTLSSMAYMPVYDSENGRYRFFAYELNNLGVRPDGEDCLQYGFAIDFENPEAYALLAQADSGVEVGMALQLGRQGMDFVFDAACMQEYAALQMKYPSAQAALMLNVTGLEHLEEQIVLMVTPSVTAAGVTCTGTAMGETAGEAAPEGKTLLEVKQGVLFNLADNTELDGLPAGNSILLEDLLASGGAYCYTQIPNVFYDSDTDLVYVNYTRHRDAVVDYPYDSTRVYQLETLLNAKSGAQLQASYVDMRTDDHMFFTSMSKLNSGELFFQNYVAYYINDTTAKTYTWVVNDGVWQMREGKVTIPQSLARSGPQPDSNWHRYAFTRTLIELDDGTLLAGMYGTYGAIMVQSKDNGYTWTYRSTIAESALGLDEPYINTDGSEITWFEPAVTRCADGSLLCVMRTWRNKPLWQCRSYDDGLSWTEPTLMPGMQAMSIYPQLMLLSNGVMVLATGVPNDTLYFSLDGCGYNWDACVTTYSGDTTGNTAIAEVQYDEATETVTLLVTGDKGFNNTKLAGIWGKMVTVSRKHMQYPKLDEVRICANETTLAVEQTLLAQLDAVFDSDRCIMEDGYTMRWESRTPEIATVDQNGVISAVSVGTAEICAVVSHAGVTVESNILTVEVYDPNALASIEVIPSEWVLSIGESGTLTKTAYNSAGEKITDSRLRWSYQSMDTSVLTVSSTGSYRAKKSGIVDVVATATKNGISCSKRITILIESNQWVTQNFDTGVMPTNCLATSGVSITNQKSYSGSRSVYINDAFTNLAPNLRLIMPEAKGVIVEFMLYVESNEHSPCFGVGYPRADGAYLFNCNAAYVGLLYNKNNGAQGYWAYDGAAWSNINRSNLIPIQKWNKIRLEITTDKAYRLYCNGTLLKELPLATADTVLNTIYFSSGGTSYTGDAYYVDDIRYMVFA